MDRIGLHVAVFVLIIDPQNPSHSIGFWSGSDLDWLRITKEMKANETRRQTLGRLPDPWR